MAAGEVRIVETVVKLGGSTLAHPDHFEAALEAIDSAAVGRRLLVVPGGGPFAEAVREADRRLRLSADAAHWMAVLAMDQCAHLISARMASGMLVAEPREMSLAFEASQVPVLAPSRWLRQTDPLPHTWEVTSDSIAAWVAGAVGARRLVLIKPPGLRVSIGQLEMNYDGVVDGYFARFLPAHVTPVIVPVDRTEALAAALCT
jgi:aspartokinase-like uncharacterized kinase